MAKRLYNLIDKEVLKTKVKEEKIQRTTLSFYKYHNIKDVESFRDKLYILLDEVDVLGRIYVSNEGINAQLSVPTNNLDAFVAQLDKFDFLKNVRLNLAIEDSDLSFFKLAIKIRNKIVADGLNDDTFDVTNRGVHLSAQDFNEITSLDDTLIVDMRNHYESEVGHFKDAIKPDVQTFKESLPIVEELLEEHKDKNIVMYCTGGIRCEKASAYFKHKGFEKVYQLDGGIIEYAREVEKQNLPNKFIGKNFVFDERMGERITEEIIAKCHQCGHPADDHVNCANDACHILFIQCGDCGTKYDSCCSEECAEFNTLDEEDRSDQKKYRVFNGTKFGKGRFPKK